MRFIFLAALSLSSCGQTPMGKAEAANDLADAAQANARTALGRIEELDSRISDLEDENRELKADVGTRQNEIEALRSEFESYKEDAVQWHHKHGSY